MIAVDFSVCQGGRGGLGTAASCHSRTPCLHLVLSWLSFTQWRTGEKKSQKLEQRVLIWLEKMWASKIVGNNTISFSFFF